MVYKIVTVSGRREVSYSVEASTKEQAEERYLKWLAFQGAYSCEAVEAVETGGDLLS